MNKPLHGVGERRGHDKWGNVLRSMSVPLWVLALLASVFVAVTLWEGIEASAYDGDKTTPYVRFGALVILAVAALGIVASRRDEQDRGKLLVLVVVMAALLVAGAWSLVDQQGKRDLLVSDYCAYGAVSYAQYERCLDDVTPGSVIYGDTDAADFAKGRRDSCGQTAGPFCQEILEIQTRRREAAEAEGEAR